MKPQITLLGSLMCLLFACTNDHQGADAAPANFQFLQQPDPDGEVAYMEALMHGRFIAQAGCLYIKALPSGVNYVPVWPAIFQYREQGEVVEILNTAGEVVARSGETIRVSGGEMSGKPTIKNADAERLLQQCAGPYWIVGEELDIVETQTLPPSMVEGINPWWTYYAEQLADWDTDHFQLVEVWTKPELQRTNEYDGIALADRPAAWLIPSPDGTRNLDLYSYELAFYKGEITAQSADSEAAVEDKVTGERTRLLFCGSACRFEAGFWQDENTVVIAGLNVGDGGRYVPTVWEVALDTGSFAQYTYTGETKEQYGNFTERIFKNE